MSDLVGVGFAQAMRSGLLPGSLGPLIRGLHQMPGIAANDSDSSDSSVRSRSRGIRRQARPQAGRGGGNTVLDFGRHEGRTYRDVARSDPGYVRWVLSVRRPQGRLMAFQRWLHANSASGNDSADSGSLLTESSESDGDEGAVSPQVLGRAVAVESRQRVPSSEMQSLMDELPRIAFSTAIFCGDPHPSACPICMEDFGPPAQASGAAASSTRPAVGGDLASSAEKGPSSTAGTGLEIVLTPCLHAFHASCLTNWLARPSAARACPTCRWDISNDGASQALRQGTRANPPLEQSRPQNIRSLLASRGDSPVAISSDSEA